jgi:hypothetical protein
MKHHFITELHTLRKLHENIIYAIFSPKLINLFSELEQILQ